jgi:hypothetical protein
MVFLTFLSLAPALGRAPAVEPGRGRDAADPARDHIGAAEPVQPLFV